MKGSPDPDSNRGSPGRIFPLQPGALTNCAIERFLIRTALGPIHKLGGLRLSPECGACADYTYQHRRFALFDLIHMR